MSVDPGFESLGRKLSTRKQIDRAVLAAKVSPSDIEESPRRKLDAFLRLPFGTFDQHFRGLDATAVTERRGRGFLDRDEHVGGRAAMREFLDANAPKQPERAEPPLALDQIFEAKRFSFLQQQLPLDHPFVGPRIADDQDVVDDRLLPLGDPEMQIGPGTVRDRRRRDHHVR